jgi:hypothetical protein
MPACDLDRSVAFCLYNKLEKPNTLENGPAAALLVGYSSIQICALLALYLRRILIATKAMLFMGQDTAGSIVIWARHQ